MKHNAKLTTLLALAEGLGVKPGELVHGLAGDVAW